jgi:hypothetical protein
MVLGVIGMENIIIMILDVDVLLTRTTSREIWVLPHSIAVFVVGGVILFLPPPLPNQQAFQQCRLIQHSFVSTRQTGRMYIVLGVIGMKNLLILGVLTRTSMQEIWDLPHRIAATVGRK